VIVIPPKTFLENYQEEVIEGMKMVVWSEIENSGRLLRKCQSTNRISSVPSTKAYSV
jgi:hypothetical protein